MSESHEQQLSAIRDDKDRALEISSTEHETELQQLKSAFEKVKAEKEQELASKTAGILIKIIFKISFVITKVWQFKKVIEPQYWIVHF